MTIRADVLDQYGDELYYAQRSLLTRVRAAVAGATLTADTPERHAALNVLYTDLAAIQDLAVHLRVLADWAKAGGAERLAAAAFWFAGATVCDKEPAQVGACLAKFYEEMCIPTYFEAGQMTSTRHARLAWVDEDDDLHHGPVAELGSHLEAAGHGAAPQVMSVYAVERGELVKVTYATASVPNGEEFTAYVTLTVKLPNGAQAQHSWTSDLAV